VGWASHDLVLAAFKFSGELPHPRTRPVNVSGGLPLPWTGLEGCRPPSPPQDVTSETDFLVGDRPGYPSGDIWKTVLLVGLERITSLRGGDGRPFQMRPPSPPSARLGLLGMVGRRAECTAWADFRDGWGTQKVGT